METKLKWITNLRQEEVEGFKGWSSHKNPIVGKPKDSGCYSTVQLEMMGLVGLYEEEKEEINGGTPDEI